MKKASIALILLLAVALVSGVACDGNGGSGGGGKIQIDDYYIGDNGGLHVFYSGPCELWDRYTIKVRIYDKNGNSAGAESWSFFEGRKLVNGEEICSDEKRGSIGLDKSGSRYDVVFECAYSGPTFTYTIYPQVR